jgi:hypothetical protein
MNLKGRLAERKEEEARQLYSPISYKKLHRTAKVEHHPARKTVQ